MDQTKIQSGLDIEAYPKAGTDNPHVEVYVYDLDSKETVKLDVRGGRPFQEDVVGYYVYRMEWTPDGSEFTFNRTNRRQNIMEFTACDPLAGSCRVVVREEWLPSWVANHPYKRFLADGKRFIWGSERTGFENLHLYDLSGEHIATLTDHDFEVSRVVRVDEERDLLWYMAHDGDNHMKQQLHRVGLDGSGHHRLTDPAFHHSVNLSPDGKHFVDIAQTHDQPPTSSLLDEEGKVVATLAESDLTKFEEMGFHRTELFTFTSADGRTELHGMLQKPSNFDPSRKYPVLVSVYGGPSTDGARESFSTPDPLTEYGFLVVRLNGRNGSGRGKRVLDAIYEKLGVVEIDDMAAGIKSLRDRPYFDENRVGIFGTSYGGYAAAMAIVRYPDVFHAASASSPVTDWRHYDTIYTERYMWTPQGNKEGYDAGSVMTYADRLKGDLMIFYGTADNNVHPNNSMQLIDALQKAGKSFEVQVGPDHGHAAINRARMMEFFIESLVLRRGRTAS